MHEYVNPLENVLLTKQIKNKDTKAHGFQMTLS